MKTLCAMLLVLTISCSQAPKPTTEMPKQKPTKSEQAKYDFYNLTLGAMLGIFFYQWADR